MRYFNTEGRCIPSRHYMVDLSSRLLAVQKMIDRGEYFSITRARQFGKTTLLMALADSLMDHYCVISLDFQLFGDTGFQTENVFIHAFCRRFLRSVKGKVPEDALAHLESFAVSDRKLYMDELFDALSDFCAKSAHPVVLLIDEVDSVSNNRVFLNFLGMLRGAYLKRPDISTFQSVILAGVYDIRSLRQRIRPEEAHRYNSPWNIAADFDVDLSFHPDDIAGMLQEYEEDHKTGMDIPGCAQEIYNYTSGYPYLVSRICKIIDESRTPGAAWNRMGIAEAAGLVEREKNTLYESLTGKIYDYPELRDMLWRILFRGDEVPYTAMNPAVDQAAMFGFIKEEKGKVVIYNRIFETMLYNLFLTSEQSQNTGMWRAGAGEKPAFIQNGVLNMDLILERFAVTFDDLYGDRDETFLEEDGRRYFLLYLRPIINGTGNYYVEARTRNNERTDVVVDFRGLQYIIELKIWRGDSYNRRGEKQLRDYLDHYHLKKGWMISYCFNKKKQVGVHMIQVGDKTLVEAVV